jgi:excisionase family DNA binding protein
VSLLTIPEGAARLRVSVRTLYRLIAAGRIRTKHVGRRAFVTERELDAFVESVR